MIATVILFVLVTVASWTDLATHKIYNWTTYPGVIVAIGLAGLSMKLERSELSTIDLSQSLIGLAVCGGIMMVCFALFKIGGGDVKLIAMTGAFTGPAYGLEILLWTFILGAAVSMLILIWRLGAVNLGMTVLQQLFSKMQFGNWQPLSEQQQQQLKSRLYLAPCTLLALVIVHLAPVTILTQA